MCKVKIKDDSDDWAAPILMIWGRKQQQRIAMQLKKMNECMWEYLKYGHPWGMCYVMKC